MHPLPEAGRPLLAASGRLPGRRLLLPRGPHQGGRTGFSGAVRGICPRQGRGPGGGVGIFPESSPFPGGTSGSGKKTGSSRPRDPKAGTGNRRTKAREGPVIKYGIFGDIHGNLEAFEAVLADMEDQGVTHPLCLGDLVGYGANPVECVEVVRALKCPVVRGNHDDFVTHGKSPVSFSEAATVSLEYARRQMSPSQLNFLRRLPLVYVEDPFTLVHATLDGPDQWGYISTRLEAQTCLFYQKTPLCFVGHTHRPCPLEFRQVDVHPDRTKAGRRFLFNVGSVGQPRDGDWRASYAIYSPREEQVDLRRVNYDIEKASQKILKSGLPESLAKRLFRGE
ncbi:MAG: metallophosphoesterase [Verrucomicrobia bacterium]|nr:metallophosphoesterase [Verrucomicrobiota bacterium]